ncbi:helix-turn-helix transcriptional regulator, partial [Herbaspirillum rhizosphaerae]
QELGLSIAQLSRLAGLSRKTVSQLEQGQLKDMGFYKLQILLQLLGLSFGSLSITGRERKQGLWMAAQNTNVSYKSQISTEELRAVLLTLQVPNRIKTNVIHFLDEAPLSMLTMAVEETGGTPEERKAIWGNIKKLAKLLQVERGGLWRK